LPATTKYCFLKMRKQWEATLPAERRTILAAQQILYKKVVDVKFQENCVVEGEIRFSAYCLLQRLAGETSGKQFLAALKRFKDEFPDQYDFMEARTCSVEIFRDGEVHRVFFEVPQICIQLQSCKSLFNAADDVIQDIDRDNPAQKANQLKDRLCGLIKTLDHYKWLFRSPMRSSMVQRLDLIDGAQFNVALLQTAGLVLFFGEKEHPYEEYGGGGGWAEIIGAVLAGAQVLASMMKLMEYVMVELPEELEEVESTSEEPSKDQEESIPPYKLADPPLPIEESESNARIILGPIWGGIFLRACSDVQFWYLISYLSFAAVLFYNQVSRAAGGPSNTVLAFASGFLLFDYFRMPAGLAIMESVIVGGPGLVNSFKCALVLIFAWGTLSFAVFQDEIQLNNDCQTAYQCLTLAIDAGLHGDMAGLYGDDFGNVLNPFPIDIYDQPKKVVGWVFVTVFFLIWEYILAGIVQGYIVDAFSEIRGEQADKELDITTVCLICSLDRQTLDKYDGFFYHIGNVHSRKDYLYFLQFNHETRYMKVLDSVNDHKTGILAYVSKQIDEGKSGFIPVGVSYAMQKEGAQDDSERLESLSLSVEDRMNALEQRMTDMQGTILAAIENNRGSS